MKMLDQSSGQTIDTRRYETDGCHEVVSDLKYDRKPSDSTPTRSRRLTVRPRSLSLGRDSSFSDMQTMWRTAILITAFGLVSCASPEPPKVVMRSMSPEKLQSMTALEAEFEEVTLEKVPVVSALSLLQSADRAWPQEMPSFMFAINPTGPPSDKDRHSANPKVNVRMRGVTLGAVLDELCEQTGWAMTAKHGGQRVDFYPTGQAEY